MENPTNNLHWLQIIELMVLGYAIPNIFIWLISKLTSGSEPKETVKDLRSFYYECLKGSVHFRNDIEYDQLHAHIRQRLKESEAFEDYLDDISVDVIKQKCNQLHGYLFSMHKPLRLSDMEKFR